MATVSKSAHTPDDHGASWSTWTDADDAGFMFGVPFTADEVCKVVEVDSATGAVVALIDDTMNHAEAEAFASAYNEILGRRSRVRAVVLRFNDERAAGLEVVRYVTRGAAGGKGGVA